MRAALLAFSMALLTNPLCAQHHTNSRDYNFTGLLDGLLQNYDKRLRPNHGGEAVEVGVSMYVLDISSFSEENMEYTIDMYLRHHWLDPRLRYDHVGPAVNITISPGADFAQHIWTPDTFVVNERSAHITNPLTAHEFVRIAPSGAVLRSIRMTVTASCPMSMMYFPMDRHMCALEFESYGYGMSDIRYKWKDGASSLGVSYFVTLPQFRLLGYRAKEMEGRLSSGNYSRMLCEFLMVRTLAPYVMHSYLPAGLVVAVAWASLWLERGSTARAALAGAALLTITALCGAAPRTPVFNALDLYHAFCALTIVAALLEYAFVCYMVKRSQGNEMRFKAIQKLAEEHNKEVHLEKGGSNGGVPSTPLPAATLSAAAIDKHARAILPVAFVAFNLIYWVIYVHIGDAQAADLILV
ncbi:gamma-aminobutyric acid receptor subunit beta-like [Ischnura elegans]|uniref:gamma-aminobutyric acid receptor subunit beta-like n=1 Tax=Ischnura elegans TaxID=197161 RepID=UPI001ED8849F|nr:gamma-aminobutyric acid receptor subunit beta-like [Ischnura elegans]